MPPVVVAAVAVGATAAVLGASLFVAGVAAIAGGALMSSLQNSLKPDLPNGTLDPQNDQAVKTGGALPRNIIYGEGIVGGQLVGYAKIEVGDDDYHVMVMNCAGHRCESLEVYEIEGKKMTEIGGLVDETYYLGEQIAADSLAVQWISGWTHDHIGFDQTYAVLRIKIDGDAFPAGINEVKFKVKGKKIYDPREDSTQGGSGPQRANDPDTWTWSDNPQLCALDYARFHGYKEQPIRRFPLDFVAITANYCDETVVFNDRNGVSRNEKRFTCNGVLNNGLRPKDGLDNIMTTMMAKLYRIGGKMYIKPAMYTGPATVTLYADEAKELNNYKPHRPEKEKVNTLRARYIEPDLKYQFTDSGVISSAGYISDDGKALESDVRLPMTNSETMAQRILHLALERNRAGFIANHIENGIRLDITPGMVARFQDPDSGLTMKEFLVEMVNYDTSKNQTLLALIEDGPQVYPDNLNISQSDITPNTTLSEKLSPVTGIGFEDIYDGTHQRRIVWTANYYQYEVLIEEIIYTRNLAGDIVYDGNGDPLVSEYIERVRIRTTSTEYLVQGLSPADYRVRIQSRDRLGRVSTNNVWTTFDIQPDQTYTWRVYADDKAGLNISASDDTKPYIGFQFGKYDPTPDIEKPADYAWFPNTAARWIFGDGPPDNSVGQQGWTYLDNTTGNIYIKNALGVWDGPVGNISGGDGDKWLSGANNPSATEGTNGDFWINTTTYELFQKTNGVWQSRGIIKGADGSDGAPGTSNGQVQLYQKSATEPNKPGISLTWDFANASLVETPDNGWVTKISDVGDADSPIWVTVASVASQTSTDTIAPTEWTQPFKLVENGEDGLPGINSATVFLFQRTSTTTPPAKPSIDLNYNFAAKAISLPNNGWKTTSPSTGGRYRWMILATAASTESTDVIAASEWSDPVVTSEDGDPGVDGYSQATVYLYKRSSNQPTGPTITTTYTFATKALSEPDGNWERNLGDVGNGNDPIWIIAATAVSQGENDDILSDEWSTPVKMAQDGTEGNPGVNTATIFIYRRSAVQPTKPTVNATYTFATANLTALNNGWFHDLSDASNSTDQLWLSTAVAVSASNSDQILAAEWSTPTKVSEDGVDGDTWTTAVYRSDSSDSMGWSRDAQGNWTPVGTSQTIRFEEFKNGVLHQFRQIQIIRRDDGRVYTGSATGTMTWQSRGNDTRNITLEAWSLFTRNAITIQVQIDGLDGSDAVQMSGFFQLSGSVWSDAVAEAAVTANGRTKQQYDTVTITNGTDFSETRFWNGLSWEIVRLAVDGNFVVNGQAIFDNLAANSIDAKFMNLNTLDVTEANWGDNVTINANGVSAGPGIFGTAFQSVTTNTTVPVGGYYNVGYGAGLSLSVNRSGAGGAATAYGIVIQASGSSSEPLYMSAAATCMRATTTTGFDTAVFVNTSTGSAVRAQSNLGKAVEGTASGGEPAIFGYNTGNGPGGYFGSNTGPAIQAVGDIEVLGSTSQVSAYLFSGTTVNCSFVREGGTRVWSDNNVPQKKFVENGTGTGQLAGNRTKIGWGGSRLLLEVDSTDFGHSWPIRATVTSDIRSKTVFSREHSALDKVCSLGKKGYLIYAYKGELKELFIGLSAQDVEPIFPHFVIQPNGVIKYKQLDSSAMVAPLYTAVNELNDKVEDEVAEIRAMIDSLTIRLEALEQ